MSRYEQVRDTLAEALGPVAAYLERAHTTVDASDPKQAGKLRHVTQIEALVEAVADFGEVVDAQLSGPDWQHIALVAARHLPARPLSPLLARCQAHLQQPHLQQRANLPLPARQVLVTITSHHLPPPSDARPL